MNVNGVCEWHLPQEAAMSRSLTVLLLQHSPGVFNNTRFIKMLKIISHTVSLNNLKL